jgi:hypothetical protein
MTKATTNNTTDSIYEYPEEQEGRLRVQLCPVCKSEIGDMPGTPDAICHNCGYKDPCCE